MDLIFPPVTPEGLYLQDKRRRKWEDEERRYADVVRAGRLHRQNESEAQYPSPRRATQVLEAVTQILDTYYIPKTIEGRPPMLSERVRYLERVAASPG